MLSNDSNIFFCSYKLIFHFCLQNICQIHFEKPLKNLKRVLCVPVEAKNNKLGFKGNAFSQFVVSLQVNTI